MMARHRPRRFAEMSVQRADPHPIFELASVRVTALVSPSHGEGADAILYRVTLAPGQSLPAHRHDHDELYLLLEGERTAFQDGVADAVAAGDSVRIPAGGHHAPTAGEDGAVQLVTMLRGTLFIPDDAEPRVPARGI
jgi:quercetin dioxygenase-like cupin family protein